MAERSNDRTCPSCHADLTKEGVVKVYSGVTQYVRYDWCYELQGWVLIRSYIDQVGPSEGPWRCGTCSETLQGDLAAWLSTQSVDY